MLDYLVQELKKTDCLGKKLWLELLLTPYYDKDG